jgi:quercetin dioxygenase-like cupin family protein
VLPGFGVSILANSRRGVQTLSMQHVTLQPSTVGMPWHIHEFDQIYFILSGTLTVEIGEHHKAGPNDLVVLPAGVPHRNWNNGTVDETHPSLLVFEPEAGAIVDRGVDFALIGSNI